MVNRKGKSVAGHAFKAFQQNAAFNKMAIQNDIINAKSRITPDVGMRVPHIISPMGYCMRCFASPHGTRLVTGCVPKAFNEGIAIRSRPWARDGEFWAGEQKVLGRGR